MAEKQTKEEQKKLHIELMDRLVTLSTSGFGLVAALAWNNVIQEFVNNYIKKWIPGSGLFWLFIYALIITALAVIITYELSKIAQRLKD